MDFFSTREEVAKMWHKREAEWEREKVAREKLIAEVVQLHAILESCEWVYIQSFNLHLLI